MNWTTPMDVRAKLARRWRSGEFLSAYVRGDEFVPLSIPIRGPTAAQIGARYDDVREWCRGWDSAAGVRLERRAVGGKIFGTNEIPARAHVANFSTLTSLLRASADVRSMDTIRAQTANAVPELLDWLAAKPMTALQHADVWPRLLSCVRWIRDHESAAVYLRQVDAEGVDTKFVEAHRSVLGALLDHVLVDDRIDRSWPASQFVKRYRFRTKPSYVRFRVFGDPAPFPLGISELTLRADELTALAPAVSRVYIVENDVTYLAFPDVVDAMVIFGSGYALSRLGMVSWLGERELHYWGDIDTHGFAILDRLRQHFPAAKSMLMDRATLLAHELHWQREDSQVNTALQHLEPSEAQLYHDLVEDTFGESVRLEQERIRFGIVRAATDG